MDKRLRLNGKGIIGFLTVFIALLWLWSFFRSYLLFMTILLMITGVIISAAGLCSVDGKIRVEIVLPRHRVGKDTDIGCDIRFLNTRRFVGAAIDVTYRCGNLFTGSREERTEKLWAAPRKGGNLSHLISSRYAGCLQVSVEEFRVYDLLHLCYLSYRAKEASEVSVWPAFTDGEEAQEPDMAIEGFPSESESRKRGTEYNPDYEVREYQAGDELKSIHWKLSAKQDRMMVRERLAAGREKINVLLPLGEDIQENDALMESLYGIGRLLLAREYPIQLFWQGTDQELCSRYIAEAGELENGLGEILSMDGRRGFGSVEEQMCIEHPSENYVLVRAGAYQGTYVSGMQESGQPRGRNLASADTLFSESGGARRDGRETDGFWTRLRHKTKKENTADVSLIKVSDSGRYDLLALSARTLVLFLPVYGSIGGFLAAFEIPFHSGFCMLALFAFAFVLSAAYETGKRWLTNLTSLLALLLFVFIAVRDYWVINSGYYYILNRIFDVAREYLKVSEGMEYALMVEDGYTAVTTFALFLGMVGIILLNIRLQNKTTLCRVMLLTGIPYIIPMYFDRSLPLLYLILVLTGYAAVAMLSYGRGRISGQMRCILPIAAAVVILFVRAVAFFVSEQDYTRIVPQSEAKALSGKGMERLARYGMAALYPQDAAGSGVGGGKLSKASANMPSGETALIVRYTPYSFSPVYLKAFTGVDYIGTSWTKAAMEWPEDGNMEMSLYERQRRFEEIGGDAYQGQGIMEVERKTAGDTFEYRPYYTDYCDIEEKDGTFSYRYYPDHGMPVPAAAKEPYIRYLHVPSACETAVRQVCEEAGLNGTEGEIARQIVNYFEENYHYTLRPGFYYGNPDYISHFLLESKKGYCAHFASAATMLFRQVGIPARYVEGYAFSYADVVEKGELVEGADYNDYYSGFSELGATALIRIEIPEASAHAWVEIFDSERGWIVVDPTPSSDEEETTSFWDIFMRNEDGEAERTLGENVLGEYIENAMGVMIYVFLAAFIIAAMLLAAFWMIRKGKERRLPGRERVKLEYRRLRKAAAGKNRDFQTQSTLKEQIAWMRENCSLELSEKQEEALYQVFFAEKIDYDCGLLCRELRKCLRSRRFRMLDLGG